MKNYLGDYLKNARLEKGYTQMGLANELNVHYRRIQQWEKEHVVPGAKYIIKLIKILNLDIDKVEECISLDED